MDELRKIVLEQVKLLQNESKKPGSAETLARLSTAMAALLEALKGVGE